MPTTTERVAKTTVPSSADIERASKFAREPFLLDGEGPEALAPGTARRRALDAALAELDAGAEHPSIAWRRDFALLLGLERLLSDERPILRDGAELSAHQVDALSGTLAELMTQQQAESPATAAEAEPEAESAEEPPGPGAESEDAESGEDAESEALSEDEEPQDWVEEDEEDDEVVKGEVEEDPGAARRFWFEHATGAGKTVAAVGFIDAIRTGGVLILT